MKKLGTIETGFVIFKSTVATGILYMPVSFVSGGWAFSAFAVILALIFSLVCLKLLLQVRIKLGGTFAELGQMTYGRAGRAAVDITLFVSQFGFVCAYIYFITS